MYILWSYRLKREKMFEINIDYKKTFSWVEFKKTMSRVENIAALVILVTFLVMPFAGPVYFLALKFLGYGYLYNKAPLLLIIPILLVIIIFIRPTCKSSQKLKVIKLITSLFIILSSVYIFFNESKMQLGFYVVFLSGIFMILGTLDKFQLKNALPPINELATEDIDIDSNEDK